MQPLNLYLSFTFAMDFLTSSISSMDERHPAEPAVMEKEELRIFAKAYAIDQLRKNGYSSMADRLTDFRLNGTLAQHLINKIADRFADERREQLEEICFELQITADTLQETFQAVSEEMFRSSIKWGRIVSFIAFSGALAVYCASHKMESKVEDVLKWTENFIFDRLSTWISSNGGWEGLVNHFVGQETSLTSYIPNVFIGVGLTALAIAGGLLAYKKKLILL